MHIRPFSPWSLVLGDQQLGEAESEDTVSASKESAAAALER